MPSVGSFISVFKPFSTVCWSVRKYPWVKGLHVHVGSQVATLPELVEAVRRVVSLAEGHPRIAWLDVGGGLPTRYRESDQGIEPSDYFQALLEVAPGITSYRLLTEMGRVIQANCGFAVSRVEYVSEGNAVVHFGADFALRECYNPAAWYHDFTLYDAAGHPKSGPVAGYDVYGPLCFSGDRLAKRRALPMMEEGDLLVMHDCGGYTLSMWSRYCSRAMPEVVGWEGGAFRILRRRETEDEVVRFWAGTL